MWDVVVPSDGGGCVDWAASVPRDVPVNWDELVDLYSLQHCPSGVALGRNASLPDRSIKPFIFLFKYLVFLFKEQSL